MLQLLCLLGVLCKMICFLNVRMVVTWFQAWCQMKNCILCFFSLIFCCWILWEGVFFQLMTGSSYLMKFSLMRISMSLLCFNCLFTLCRWWRYPRRFLWLEVFGDFVIFGKWTLSIVFVSMWFVNTNGVVVLIESSSLLVRRCCARLEKWLSLWGL